ncbi:MAG: PQQ-binding-like beta-propeller repeat protein [Candidatus Andersenbacteria bacterium]|nr:PQQ-binding-like beta-propeller repeat protein [bacterium]MDZ4225492.1 PQQ-binding-like beta-propeller repeat protein [Candidatus Andersenbacteria bacterium]
MRKRVILAGGLAIVIVGAGALFLRFVVGVGEDDWICVDGQWVAHGHPADARPEGGCRGGLAGLLPQSGEAVVPQGFTLLWFSDFKGNRIGALDKSGEIVWQQQMAAAPMPVVSFDTAAEYVTIAPNGNLIVSDGEGMMVQEINRQTHELVWQYGVKDIQGYGQGYLHQPDKAYKINDHEVIINDGNNRRVIIVDQNTNDVVWQYGETRRMGSAPGLLRGNTMVMPYKGDQQFIITDTLEKKIMIVDRATKNIVWEWAKPDAKWLQHVWPTAEDTFVMEDRQKGEVFEVNKAGQILWTLNSLSDESAIHYPTEALKLGNGNVLIAESGRGRVVEVVPQTGEVVKEYKELGFATTIAIDQQAL